MLTGLWHGASWNFVIWGLLYGILLVIEKLGGLKILEKIPAFFSRIYVMLVVMLGFIIFNSTDLTSIAQNLGGLIGIGNIPFANAESIFYLKDYISIILIGGIFSTPIIKNIITKIKEKNSKLVNILEPITLSVLLVLCISYLVDGSFNPFLYFRF